jgi:LysR family transcriptional regulator, regulator of the ytmI operon
MDLKALKTFETITRLGSFQKAAEELRFAQSTVTFQIQRLEADLGVPLFVRTGKRVHLSEAGGWLATQVSTLLNSVDAMRTTVLELGSGEAGVVHIAGTEPTISTSIAPVIADFVKQKQQIQISIEVGGTLSIAERVSSGELDFGICSLPPARFRLQYEPLHEETLGLLVSVNHKFATQEKVSFADIAEETMILKEQACAYRGVTEENLAQRGLNPPSGIEVGSFDLVISIVQAGLGVGIIPLNSAKNLPDSLVIRCFDDLELNLTVGIVHNPDKVMGKAAQSLLDRIRTYYLG